MVGYDAVSQIKWTLRYVNDRYGTPIAARDFWLNRAPLYDFNGDGKPDGNHWY